MKLRTIQFVILGMWALSAAEAPASKPVDVSEPVNVTTSAEAEKAEATDNAEKATDASFERYKTITDRMPFGPEPSGFNPDAPPGTAPKGGGAAAAGEGGLDEQQRSEEEMKILSSVRVSMLNVTPSGKIAVGFTDSSRQPSANYYLKVGETRDGWTVKDADARALTVVLANQEGVEATLKLGETAGGDAKGGKKGPAGGLRRLPSGRPAVQQSNEPASPGSALANLRARRQLREANAAEERARQAAAAAEEKKAREQAAADREQQREALLQIQEELRRQRELREQQQQEQQEQSSSETEQE